MRGFFAQRGVEPAGLPAPQADEPFLDTAPEPEPVLDADGERSTSETEQAKSALQRIAAMTVAQRMAWR